MSGYGLDDRAIEVRSSVETKDFSSILCVHTGSGAHPASCTMGTGGPSPGTKSKNVLRAGQITGNKINIKDSTTEIPVHRQAAGVKLRDQCR
jgi:hypothetical protein